VWIHLGQLCNFVTSSNLKLLGYIVYTTIYFYGGKQKKKIRAL